MHITQTHAHIFYTTQCQIVCYYVHFNHVFIFKIDWKYLPPATKLPQGNVFTPVCHSVHRGVCHIPRPWADTPLGRHLPGQTPPHTVHAGIWSTSGRYASYWNAILLLLFLVGFCETIDLQKHSESVLHVGIFEFQAIKEIYRFYSNSVSTIRLGLRIRF